MKEFIKRPENVEAALARVKAAQEAGALLTNLKHYKFESKKDYSGQGTFSIEKGELWIAFCKDSINHESEFWLNSRRVIYSPTIDAFDKVLWNTLQKIIADYGDVRYNDRDAFSKFQISERALFEHMVVIYNGESSYVNCLIEDEIEMGYFSSATNNFYSDVIKLFLYETLVLVRDEYKALEALLDLIKREDD